MIAWTESVNVEDPRPARTSPSMADCVTSARAKSSGVVSSMLPGLAGEHAQWSCRPSASAASS